MPNALSTSLFSTLREVLDRKGLRGTIAAAMALVSDVLFDLRYGTDTVLHVPLRSLSIDSVNVARGVDYAPTQVVALRRLLQRLELGPSRNLLDFGCGKGRVLLLASEFGFRALRGVDFSPELCAVAERNWRRYADRTGSTVPCQIVCRDVVDYELQGEDVLFFFNPFDAVVLALVLQNVMRSLAREPRPMWIIYRNPVHEYVIAQCSSFTLQGRYFVAGSDFSVFAHAG